MLKKKKYYKKNFIIKDLRKITTTAEKERDLSTSITVKEAPFGINSHA